MEIKPKYEVGDIVKLNIENSETIGTIEAMEATSIDKGCYTIEYVIKAEDDYSTYYTEDEILCKID